MYFDRRRWIKMSVGLHNVILIYCTSCSIELMDEYCAFQTVWHFPLKIEIPFSYQCMPFVYSQLCCVLFLPQIDMYLFLRICYSAAGFATYIQTLLCVLFNGFVCKWQWSCWCSCLCLSCSCRERWSMMHSIMLFI